MPNTKHVTDSGFWFVLREPQDVPERLRRPVVAKLASFIGTAKAAFDNDDLAAAVDATAQGVEVDEAKVKEALPDDLAEVFHNTDELNDLLALALLVSWSVETPITLDALLDLPSGDYKAISQKVAPMMTALMPDFSVSPEKDSPSTP